mmetsp:Transcript_66861/g.207068  ORF Transcript_66861/g.207068 Transcript_66861/m.207068 type:complete len:206 (-) Transcript_66861:1510-2127(-)
MTGRVVNHMYVWAGWQAGIVVPGAAAALGRLRALSPPRPGQGQAQLPQLDCLIPLGQAGLAGQPGPMCCNDLRLCNASPKHPSQTIAGKGHKQHQGCHPRACNSGCAHYGRRCRRKCRRRCRSLCVGAAHGRLLSAHRAAREDLLEELLHVVPRAEVRSCVIAAVATGGLAPMREAVDHAGPVARDLVARFHALQVIGEIRHGRV